MEETRLFVLLTSPMGLVLGTITQSSFNLWKDGKAKLEVDFPKSLKLIPGQQQGDVQSIQMVITELYPVDTAQESVVLSPDAVEVIGELETDVDGSKICKNKYKLYLSYEDSVNRWKASNSNLVLPNSQDVANINQQNNVTKFPLNKK